MCKLFSLSNTTQLSATQIKMLTALISQEFSHTERDGFGVSIKARLGKIIEHRWLRPLDARLDYKANFSQSIIFHGRTSTNQVSLLNTHPIRRDGISLCHNGVVEDINQDYSTRTTTDSELLTHRISQGIVSVETNIVGYYAAIFHRETDDRLTVFRDNIASLYYARIDSINSYVFSTRAQTIESVARIFDWTISDLKQFPENTIKEFYLGHEISGKGFTPKGRSSYADSLSSLSLGHDLTDDKAYQDLSIEIFFAEIDNLADSSWAFFRGDKELTLDQFFDLDDSEKMKCLVIRHDGTVCSIDDRLNGQVFDYAMLRGA